MFKKIFGQNEKEVPLFEKIPLTESLQLETIQKQSFEKPVIIFKHSTRCGISSSVLRRFDQKFVDFDCKYHYYFLNLLKHRGISNRIAEVFNVEHQSPQVLIIQEGNVITHKSHYDILDIDL